MAVFGKKILTIIVLAALCFWAGFRSFDSFQKTSNRKLTVDEVVYVGLAIQMIHNPLDYSVGGFALRNALKDTPKELPRYFYRPLFKHPPLYCGTLALSLKAFHKYKWGVLLPSLGAGVLLIVLAFLIGSVVANRVVGLGAAVLMALDPVRIMCSQKLWMDTFLAFWMVLAVYCFLKFLYRQRVLWAVLFGVSAGFAGLVKYPGFLVVIAAGFSMMLWKRDGFKRPAFWLALVTIVLLQIPWAAWNIYVYGWSFLLDPFAQHGGWSLRTGLFVFGSVVVLGMLSGIFLFKKDSVTHFDKDINVPKGILLMRCVFAAVFFGTIIYTFKERLLFFAMPEVTWIQGFFTCAPKIFYFGRLIQFCYLYALGFLVYIFRAKEESIELKALKLYTLLVLIFFTVWGSFQSRYILAAVPGIAVLSSLALYKIFVWLGNRESVVLRIGGQSLLLIAVLISLSRMIMINEMVSFTNNMCYF